MASLNCPFCNAEMEISESFAGDATCPACNKAFSVDPGLATKDCPFCGETIKASAIKCKHCGEFLDGRPRQSQPSTPAQAQITAKVVRKSQSFGVGCLLQIIGLGLLLIGLLTIFSIIGPLICLPLAIILLIAGQKKAYWKECGHCGSRLESVGAVCPHCNAKFT